MSNQQLSTKEKIAKRVAKEFKDGDVVNLGIGMPTLVSNYIDPNISVFVQSENGVVGVSKASATEKSPNLVNAGGAPVGMIKGGVFIDSLTSFALIRGGHIDATVLGGLQVDQAGNLANWMVPGKMVPGMGGAMDLVAGTKKVIIAMEHVNKKGEAKILKECTLPLTAQGVVSMIITELAVFECANGQLTLTEISEDSHLEEIKAKTEATFVVSEKLHKHKGE
ncbi:3-oxoacid CoA-transferase subunit B [Isobaculum melis]|uniref:Acetate CoA/acetoacetate CoA-transferase beta subunit n=1 Tax=Isobaculum melis TaxID=142588 RepID=A0A1H9QT06_9LACT|nr:3-oxoacid CoA-transferase subunit B [Isobaculum melis]SER63604.1 acetate CoA/acetoacetate CoA-transferase beta subunit [Isobaculum melis]